MQQVNFSPQPSFAAACRLTPGGFFRALLGYGCATILLCGCGGPSKTVTNAATGSQPLQTAPMPPLNRPAGTTQTAQVVAGVMLLGTVPYDNMVLPLVSPDGRFIATQSGAPATWPTALAEFDAEIPNATRVEVYELDLRENIAQENRHAPALIASLSELALLGRSCDAEGFLVESPRPDGSRWIGKAGWRGGEIQWLVQDDHVNAFASIGLNGRMAWSRRPIEGGPFELLVRHGSDEFVLGTIEEDWLMPTWSGRGNGLFVLNLAAGNLELRFGNASSEASLRQSMQRLSLAMESDVYTAYQAVIGQAAAIDPSLPARDQLVFFHPGFSRVAIWRPLAVKDRQGIYLNARSVAAAVDHRQEDFAFVSTDTHLLRQNLRNAAERIELVGGVQIPRQTISAAWPYILLSPGEGHVGITAMRLLERDQAIFSSRQNPR